jgi:hypothetical protein
MTGEVLGRVLPLPIRVVGRWPEDRRPMRSGALVVLVGVFHTHQHRVRQINIVRRIAPIAPAQFGQDDCPVANIELCAVVPNQNAQGESEGVAKPRDCLTHIRIRDSPASPEGPPRDQRGGSRDREDHEKDGRLVRDRITGSRDADGHVDAGADEPQRKEHQRGGRHAVRASNRTSGERAEAK